MARSSSPAQALKRMERPSKVAASPSAGSMPVIKWNSVPMGRLESPSTGDPPHDELAAVRSLVTVNTTVLIWLSGTAGAARSAV